jgi:NCAIR mutase (PurE)-related protein
MIDKYVCDKQMRLRWHRTSVGYSNSLGMMTTLPATLNSCSADVAMVNIKNGFESDFVAALIKR